MIPRDQTMHSSSSEALERPLPATPFFSIEYPGYVRSTSIPLAITNLGGQASINDAFKRTATKADALLELSLRPGNPFAHPVPGDVVSTSNLLLKVVKRKRRRVEGQAEGGVVGEYTAEVVGVVSKTVRFRSEYSIIVCACGYTKGGCTGMVDYQYKIDMNDPVAKLRLAMDNMDGKLLPLIYFSILFQHTFSVEAIRKYSIPVEKEDYTLPADPILDPQLVPEAVYSQSTSAFRSNLRLFPPPLFSRQGISQNYKYVCLSILHVSNLMLKRMWRSFKPNPASMESITIDEETGEERKRLINKGRWKGYGPASIMFIDQTVCRSLR